MKYFLLIDPCKNVLYVPDKSPELYELIRKEMKSSYRIVVKNDTKKELDRTISEYFQNHGELPERLKYEN